MKSKYFIMGFLVASILTASIPAMAQSINIVFNNIKIIVDNKEVTLKDAKGNTLKPILYNGTNYLPLRAISELLGKEVNYDSKTGNVYVGCDIPRISYSLIGGWDSVSGTKYEFWNDGTFTVEYSNISSTKYKGVYGFIDANTIRVRFDDKNDTYIYKINFISSSKMTLQQDGYAVVEFTKTH